MTQHKRNGKAARERRKDAAKLREDKSYEPRQRWSHEGIGHWIRKEA